MNNLKNSQQNKFDPNGKALASLILGIISLAPEILALILTIGMLFGALGGGGIGASLSGLTTGILKLFGIFTPLILVAPIGGIILGIMGLKSTAKNWAITGIILSTLALISWLRQIEIFLKTKF